MKRFIIPILTIVLTLFVGSCKKDKNELKIVFDSAKGVYYGNIHDTKSGNYVIELSKDGTTLILDLFSIIDEDPDNAYPYSGTYTKGSVGDLTHGQPGTFYPGFYDGESSCGTYIDTKNVTRYLTSGEIVITNQGNNYGLYIEMFDINGFRVKAHFNGPISFENQFVPVYTEMEIGLVNYLGDVIGDNSVASFELFLQNTGTWGEEVLRFEGFMDLVPEGDDIIFPAGEYVISTDSKSFCINPGTEVNDSPMGSYYYLFDNHLQGMSKVILFDEKNAILNVSKEGEQYNIIVNMMGLDIKADRRLNIYFKFKGSLAIDDQSEREPNPPEEEEEEG